MRRSRFTTPGLLFTHFGAGVSVGALLVLLVFVTSLALSLVPRALPLLGDAELQHELAKLDPLEQGFLATGEFRFPSSAGEPPGVDEIFGPTHAALATLPERLAEPLADLIGAPAWLARTPSQRTAPPNSDDISLTLALAVDLAWESRVSFVDGSPPAPWTATGNNDLPIEIVLSADAAESMSLRVGDLVPFSPAPLLVSGSYELADPDDPYWSFAGDLAGASQTAVSQGSFFSSAAYVDPMTAANLKPLFSGSAISAWFPMDVAGIRYSEGPALLEQVRSAGGIGVSMPSGGQLVVATGVGTALEVVGDRVNSFIALIALVASGPLGVIFAVNALGAQSVVERRRPALALASARGASGFRLRALMLIEGAVIAIPATALAIVLAALVLPAKAGIAAIWLPAIFAIALTVLFAAFTPMQVERLRVDTAVRAKRKYRWVLELAVAGLAGLSLLLLMRRGLVESSAVVGLDPLLAAMPLLLAITVCLAVLRLYPLPLLALMRGLRLRRGAIGILGASHAVRAPALGFAGAFALVVGMTFAIFSGVLGSTVSAAIQSTAAESVAADIRIEAADLDDRTITEIAGLDGVRAITALGLARQVVLEPDDGRELLVTVVFADTSALQHIWPGVGPQPDELEEAHPAILVSSDIARELDEGLVQLGETTAVIVGPVPDSTLRGMSQRWVVVDRSFAVQVSGSEAGFVRALAAVDEGADPALVAGQVRAIVVAGQQSERAAGSVQVLDTKTERDELAATPVIAGLQVTLAIAAASALLLSAVTVVVASTASASRRRKVLGVLRTLGLTPRQAGLLAVWELMPVAMTAVVAGASLGLALPWVVTVAVDLRPFVGGAASPLPAIDPYLVAATAAVFALVVAIAGGVAAAIARKLSPGNVLKMGAE